MKKLILVAIAAALAGGCSLTTVETPEWRATVRSHWFKRDLDKLDVQRKADGSYSVSLNGYKSDASEQLPQFAREMWLGLGILGRIAAASVNPVAATVPLTTDAADPTAVTAAVNAASAAKVSEIKAKADAKTQKAASATDASECADGSCGIQ